MVNRPRQSPNAFFGDVWYHPGGFFGPRRQPDYQLVIIHAGEARIRFNEDECLVPPGGVALMRPGWREMYHFSRDHRTHHTWCSINPSFVPAMMRRRLQKAPAALPQSKTFDHLMQAAFGMVRWNNAAAHRTLDQIGLSLLNEYERLASSGADESENDSPWVVARNYLETHFAESDCLQKAATAARVSPQHLNRLFRAHFDSTPGRYLWNQRVEQGVGLLIKTGLSVSEIADRSGFKNAFHFSRLVRASHQAPPREVRRRAWKLR